VELPDNDMKMWKYVVWLLCGGNLVIYTLVILIVQLLVIIKNNKICTVHVIKLYIYIYIYILL